jgi:hypothetical protein
MLVLDGKIVGFLHHVVLTTTKEAIFVSSIIYIFVDEIIIIDNQNWISMHFYVVVSWKKILILLTLEHLVEGGNFGNIKNVVMVILIMYGGLTNEEIVEWVVCLGIDVVSMFEGVKSRIIVLMRT